MMKETSSFVLFFGSSRPCLMQSRSQRNSIGGSLFPQPLRRLRWAHWLQREGICLQTMKFGLDSFHAVDELANI